MSRQRPELIVPDATSWAHWLQDHGERSDGVWLVLAKKGTSAPTNLIYEDALEEAIRHGWVDGQLAARDEGTYLRMFTPRRPKSRWSKRNVAIATRMADDGRMQAPGLAAVAEARANGSWDAAYEGQASIKVPPDLATALSASPKANAMFAGLSAANRYAILYRLAAAKRVESRERRIDEFIAMLERGETIHPER